jgi:hypothetical protein
MFSSFLVCQSDDWPIFPYLLFFLFFRAACISNCCFYYQYMLPVVYLYIYYSCTASVLPTQIVFTAFFDSCITSVIFVTSFTLV